MSTGYGEGEGRVKMAIEDALNSPLLNDNDVFNSKKIIAEQGRLLDLTNTVLRRKTAQMLVEAAVEA